MNDLCLMDIHVGPELEVKWTGRGMLKLVIVTNIVLR